MKNLLSSFVFMLALPLALYGNPATAVAGLQSPVMITFDVHADQFPQPLPVEQRTQLYQQWIENGNWLMDILEPLGAKVSFLSAGEFLEFCLEDEQRENTCFPLLRRFYQSGGIIGTHTHREIHTGPHAWPELTGDPTPEEVVENWDDAKAMVDQVIREALGITDPAAIAAVNTARGSHLPEDVADQHAMLEAYGFTILEGGGQDQKLAKYFSHVPFTVYRPGDCGLCENLSANFVLPPQSMVIGEVGMHGGGVWQDGSAARKQAEMLQLLANRRIQELGGGIDKPWSYGWGVHLQDMSPGSVYRQAISVLIPWLYNNVVSKNAGVFASYPEARDTYGIWESEHPGQSSFDYPCDVTDYGHYPYSGWANHYLRYARFASRVPAAGADAFLLRAGDYSLMTPPTYPLVLSYTNGAPATVNLSSVLGSTPVRRIRLADGDISIFPSSAVRVDAVPAVVCRPMDCDAILAMESIQ